MIRIFAASSSDSGSPEWYNSTGQSKKRREPEKKDQIQLSNRFDCLEDEQCPESSCKNSDLNDRESIVCSRGGGNRRSPKTWNKKIDSNDSKSPKISPNPELPSVKGTVEHKSTPENITFNYPTSFGSIPSGISDDGVKGKSSPTKIPSSSGTIVPSIPSVSSVPSNRPRKEFGTIIFFDSKINHGYIIVDGSHENVPFRSNRFQRHYKPGNRVMFELEFDAQGKQQAINVFPYHDALSPRDPDDSDY